MRARTEHVSLLQESGDGPLPRQPAEVVTVPNEDYWILDDDGYLCLIAGGYTRIDCCSCNFTCMAILEPEGPTAVPCVNCHLPPVSQGPMIVTLSYTVAPFTSSFSAIHVLTQTIGPWLTWTFGGIGYLYVGIFDGGPVFFKPSTITIDLLCCQNTPGVFYATATASVASPYTPSCFWGSFPLKYCPPDAVFGAPGTSVNVACLDTTRLTGSGTIPVISCHANNGPLSFVIS